MGGPLRWTRPACTAEGSTVLPASRNGAVDHSNIVIRRLGKEPLYEFVPPTHYIYRPGRCWRRSGPSSAGKPLAPSPTVSLCGAAASPPG
jgi:hypothetical protein